MVKVEYVPDPRFFHPDPYPRLWSWDDLKRVVDSGDLGKLLRHPQFQKDYDASNARIAKEYGSVVNYLVNVRLGWDLSVPVDTSVSRLFTANIPDSLVRVVFNDWAYSMPPGVSHYVVWSRLPLVSPDTVPPEIWKRISYDGLWDFFGGEMKPQYDGPDAPALKVAKKELDTFARNVWDPAEWECAWFMNPPRLQSVPGLAHFHVFARKKSPEELARGSLAGVVHSPATISKPQEEAPLVADIPSPRIVYPGNLSQAVEV